MFLPLYFLSAAVAILHSLIGGAWWTVDINNFYKMNNILGVYFCFFIWTLSSTSKKIPVVESKKMIGIMLQSARKTPRLMSRIPGTSTHQSYNNCRWNKHPAFVGTGTSRAFTLATPAPLRFIRKSIAMPPSRVFVEYLHSSVDDHISETQRLDHSITSNQAESSMITQGLNPSQEEATLRPRYSITRVIAGEELFYCMNPPAVPTSRFSELNPGSGFEQVQVRI